MGMRQTPPRSSDDRTPKRRGNQRNRPGKLKNARPRELRMEQVEQRFLLAGIPTLLSILPNVGDQLVSGQTRDVAPRELTFRFDDGQQLDPLTLGAIQIVRSGFDGNLNDGANVPIAPGFIGLGDKPNEVVVRFADSLPDDLYQIRVVGSGPAPLRNIQGDAFNSGVDRLVNFELDLGAQVIAVVPQPIRRNAAGGLTQARNQIDVFFNNDDLDANSARNPSFYQLIFTNSSANNADDAVFNPSSVTYDAVADKAVLTFSRNLDQLSTGEGAYRLRIGNANPLPAAPNCAHVAPGAAAIPGCTTVNVEPGSSFGTAHSLGTLTSQARVIKSAIEPQPFGLRFPGGLDEPGHRKLATEIQNHLLPHYAADTTDGVTTIAYNFTALYGADPQGNPLTNLITEEQKQRTREIFDLYSHYLGVRFVESENEGLTIATGDPRAIDGTVPPGLGGTLGIAGVTNILVPGVGFSSRLAAVMDNAENWGPSEIGGAWFRTAMGEIGHLLGIGATEDLPANTSTGDDPTQNPVGLGAEPVFPGDHDIVHGQHLFRPDGRDIDVYRFSITTQGVLSAETIAERRQNASLLNSVISIYDGAGSLISRNDDYFSDDSFVQLMLQPGDYFVVVTSTGNTDFDLDVENSGMGGTSEGAYDLRLAFTPSPTGGLRDATGVLLDGDADGVPGGAYNFWFNVASTANTIYVDKAATVGVGALGSITNPHTRVSTALAAAVPGTVVRIVGNGGADGNVATTLDNLAYEIGFNNLGNALQDGSSMSVPRGVTVMIDAGSIFKLRRANIAVGSVSQGVDRSLGVLQVLGMPFENVIFTSYNNEFVGLDTFPAPTTPLSGDWGGLVFRNRIDFSEGRSVLEQEGIFLNYVNHADITFGGGDVVVNSVQQPFSPIHMVHARPTVTHNSVRFSADSALSADPNSFLETKFQSDAFATDYDRVGPEIKANRLLNNSINGLFVRIDTRAGQILDRLDVQARFDDKDVVHVISENLLIAGNPGGAVKVGVDGAGDPIYRAREHARLAIDAGIVVKLDGARIETEVGSQLIAEGIARNPVIFTSLVDSRFGGSGTFVTASGAVGLGSTPQPGDWGGLFFGPISKGSIDQALIAFAGGVTTIEGGFAGFNAVEIHQAEVRLTNSKLVNNAGGLGGGARQLRFPNAPGTIFVRGAQPVIVNNTIRNNASAAININVNALNSRVVADWGRSRGRLGAFDNLASNFGPLIDDNVQGNNGINGMVVRGGTLTTQSVWDDTDIVHVLFNEVRVLNHHTFSGLRLQSNDVESLVVKLQGANAGLTADGVPLDIPDRIGGSIQVLGSPGKPVVFTSLADDRVGAGRDINGQSVKDTNNDGVLLTPMAGDWRSIKLERYSNDRNVATINEQENSRGDAVDANGTPDTAQSLGNLAPREKSSDDNLRLGFEVRGTLNRTAPGDVDVYSFDAIAGTQIWIDVDRTSPSLDTVIELIDANGTVLARSNDSEAERRDPSLLVGLGRVMQSDIYHGDDLYTTNPRDAGMRLILPGPVSNVPNTYYVRVRSNSPNLTNLQGGLTKGAYQLQVRLRETNEIPGSTVRFADIRFADTGIEVLGLPNRSPLLGDSAETSGDNNTRGGAQLLGNVLASDRGTLSVGGDLDSATDVDWYQITVNLENVERPDHLDFFELIYDIDYADGAARANTTMAVYDSTGTLIFIGRDSNVTEDQPADGKGSNASDLTRGSFGKLDPFIGSVQRGESPFATYFIAVSSNAQLPTVLDGPFSANPTDPLVRLEPISSVTRIAEDHVGFSNFNVKQELFSSFDPVTGAIGFQALDLHADPLLLGDVITYVNTLTDLFTVDPFTGVLETDVTGGGGVLPGVNANPFFRYPDLAMRNDGRLYSLTVAGNNNNANTGHLRELDPADGSLVAGRSPDDGVIPHELGPNGIDPQDIGVQWNATTFSPLGNRTRALYAVGSRGPGVGVTVDPTDPNSPDGVPILNILYRFTVDENDNFNFSPTMPTDARIPTQVIERGILNLEAAGGPNADIAVITGIALVNGQMFAVTDQGGFYEIENFDGPATARFIDTSMGILDDIPFSGLSVGPQNVEGGLYSQILFATDATGMVHTITTDGEFAPLLANGAHSVATGIPGLTGIAFSPIDYNLWHVSNFKGNDVGHGIQSNLGQNFTRGRVNGGTSFRFALEDPRLNTTVSLQPGANNFVVTNQGLFNTYNVPGGANGSLTTNAFDLSDYSANDKPTLYFNYFLDTENVNSVWPTGIADMRDSIRVFASGDGANWLQLATNNSQPSLNIPNRLFELPLVQSSSGGDYRNDIRPNQRVQELFDNTGGWRQARVDLGDLAGFENVRLRFEFSTAADLDIGSAPFSPVTLFPRTAAGTGGDRLAAIAGNKLRDGDTFTIDSLNLGFVRSVFEFDTGFVLHTPGGVGASLNDRETFTLDNGDGSLVTFQFVKPGSTADAGNIPIAITNADSAGDVATAMAAAIDSQAIPNISTSISDGRVQVDGAEDITLSAGANLVVEGDPAGFVTDPGHIPVFITESMTANEVAIAMATAIDAHLVPLGGNVDDPAVFQATRVRNESITIIGHEVPALFVGNRGFSPQANGLPGKIPGTNFQAGDEFGQFLAPNGNGRARNNSFEGIFIDDIIVGFSERGEQVVDAGLGVDTFFQTPFDPSTNAPRDILTGAYQLEVRRGAQFARRVPGSTQQNALRSDFLSYDTNDRFAQQATLIAPAGPEIREGTLLRLTDGKTTVTFEFDGLGDGVAAGRTAIPFGGSDSDLRIAGRIRDAINAHPVLTVTAGTTPRSTIGSLPTSNRISLFGAASLDGLDGLTDESNDTIATAARSGLTSATQGLYTRRGVIGDNGRLFDSEGLQLHDLQGRPVGLPGHIQTLLDVDLISFQLNEGDVATIDVDSGALGTRLDTLLRIFDANGAELDINDDGLAPGEFAPDFGPFGIPLLLFADGDPFLRFVAPSTGTYYVGVSDYRNFDYDPFVPFSGSGQFFVNFDGTLNVGCDPFIDSVPGCSFGDYQIHIGVGGTSAIGTEGFDFQQGDGGPDREQGQVIIEANTISDVRLFGINVAPSTRDGAGARPHPGAVRNLPVLNTERLVPGVTIENNILVRGALGGISITGDPAAAAPQGAVPFVRVMNNTLVGTVTPAGVRLGIGVRVGANASATLLNNIVNNYQTGIQAPGFGGSTVTVGGTLYKDNNLNAAGINGLGSFPIVLSPFESLFIDPASDNYYLVPGSQAIDSSINSLQDRPGLVAVTESIGVAQSPILAPDRDLLGQLRVNDPTVPSPPGLGANVFKDRGALDRADFAGPTAQLVNPADNDSAGRDLNPAANQVFVPGSGISVFELQLVDGVLPADPQFGVGVDDRTVVSRAFRVFQDGVRLVELEGDYTFSYDATNNVVRLAAGQGLWQVGSEYVISIDNSGLTGVKDLADNTLKANEASGITEFRVVLGEVDFGDAPDPVYPTLSRSNGASHLISPGFFLGAGVTADADGQPSSNADGDDDDGVVFTSDIVSGEPATVSVTASTAGLLDAWIDFNGDGDWTDPGEKIFTGQPLAAGANNLSFTVPGGFTARDTFARFRLSSAGGLSSTGFAPDGEVEDYRVRLAESVRYSVELVYSDCILPTPGSGCAVPRDAQGRFVVSPGASVVAQVFVDDLRELGALGGVRAAFADLSYTADVIDWVDGSLEIGPTFANARAGVINEGAQLVDEAGGVGDAPTGSDPRQLVYRVTGRVKDTAAPGTILSLELDAADDTPAHSTFLFGGTQAATASFQNATLIVQSTPWRNPREARDVNGDGVVTGLDALIIINELNRNGPRILPSPPVPGQQPPPFYDVSGDGGVSPQDALIVINFLNARSAAAGLAAQSDESPSMVVDASMAISAAPDTTSSQAVDAVESAIDHVLAMGTADDGPKTAARNIADHTLLRDVLEESIMPVAAATSDGGRFEYDYDLPTGGRLQLESALDELTQEITGTLEDESDE